MTVDHNGDWLEPDFCMLSDKTSDYSHDAWYLGNQGLSAYEYSSLNSNERLWDSGHLNHKLAC